MRTGNCSEMCQQKNNKKGGIFADKAGVCKDFRAEIFSKIVNKLLKQMN